MISIVTGTLNRVSLLPSILQNTVNSNDKLELVLVDGGSTDGTLEYLKSLNHPRVKLIEHGARSYYWHYMNLGIKNSTHEYICQWNDDVLMENDWDAVISQLSQDYQMYLFSWLETPNGDYVIYDTGEQLVVNYGIYTKEVFRKIGLYNNSYKYYYCDGDMSFRAKCFGFKYKKMYDIKCKPMFVEKRAILGTASEYNNYIENLNNYKKLILPSNIEYLT